MNPQERLNRILHFIHVWKSSLKLHKFEELLLKPDPDSWSLGQVYIHLISASLNFQIKAIERCLKSSENKRKLKSFKGFLIFNILGNFPPMKIKVPASREYTPKQPKSKAEIIEGLEKTKKKLTVIAAQLEKQNKGGKVAHPALGFLNAKEWFHLIEMHFRHHLRQKFDLDQFILDEMIKKSWID